MSARGYHLAIETSTRTGMLALGLGDKLIDRCVIDSSHRHNVGLVPGMDALFAKHGLLPGDLDTVSLSVGPGSFTGLRIGVTTAKMLAMTLDVRLVAVPTLEVIAQNVTVEHVPRGCSTLAICLNTKKQSMYVGLFGWQAGQWQLEDEPEVTTAQRLCQRLSEPALVLGDCLPQANWPEHVTLLDSALATPTADAVWRVGCVLAQAKQWADRLTLEPLYARQPEAAALWEQRHK